MHCNPLQSEIVKKRKALKAGVTVAIEQFKLSVKNAI